MLFSPGSPAAFPPPGLRPVALRPILSNGLPFRASPNTLWRFCSRANYSKTDAKPAIKSGEVSRQMKTVLQMDQKAINYNGLERVLFWAKI